jgi:hypothetical protein
MMKKIIYIVAGSFIGLLILVAGFFLIIRTTWEEEFILLMISTDKDTYHVGETIHVHIDNSDDHSFDILCPANCALGNFPTTVGRFEEGDWVTLAGFCPSIEPIFGDYPVRGEYIVHALEPGGSFDLELTNLDTLKGQGNLQIMYYFGNGRSQVFSSPFSVEP